MHDVAEDDVAWLPAVVASRHFQLQVLRMNEIKLIRSQLDARSHTTVTKKDIQSDAFIWAKELEKKHTQPTSDGLQLSTSL